MLITRTERSDQPGHVGMPLQATEALHVSRLEGKIDALLRQQGIQYDPLGEVPAQVREALDQGKRILAIKRLREATGLGLKDAKDQIDELQRRCGGVAPSDR